MCLLHSDTGSSDQDVDGDHHRYHIGSCDPIWYVLIAMMLLYGVAKGQGRSTVTSGMM